MPSQKKWVVDEKGYHAVTEFAPADRTAVYIDDTFDTQTGNTQSSDESEVQLLEGKWLPGEDGFQFNKKCKVQVKARFLKETGRRKITLSTFVEYEGEEEDLGQQVEIGLNDDGIAEGEVMLYYGDKYSDALREKPEAKCHYLFKATHNTAKNELESEQLEMPRSKTNTILKKDFYDDKGANRYGKEKSGEKYVGGDVIIKLQEDLVKLGFSIIGNPDGLFGKNTDKAVREFQELSQKKHRKKGDKNIEVDISFTDKVDGVVGEKTREEIKIWLQKEYTKPFEDIEYLFPIMIEPEKPYDEGMRKFGANRSGGRKHGGCDLYTPYKTPIYAIKDGTVRIDPYSFYCETDAIEIQHEDFIARYGEVINIPNNLKKGIKVKQGDLLGYTGKLIQNGKPMIIGGKEQSMLHLEVYKGTGTGPLTQRDNGTSYKRRKDIFNPAIILDKAVRKEN